jgi:cytochrome c peroxidase
VKRAIFFIPIVVVSLACLTQANRNAVYLAASPDSLRQLYAKDPAQWPAPQIDRGATFQELGVLPSVKHPEDNPYTQQKAALGKILFFDPRLSASGSIACASCHDPQVGWGDGKSFSFGHERRQGARNAMTIINTAYYDRFFWDGRAKSLEDQLRFPVADHNEMAMDLEVMVKRLQGIKGYQEKFEEAFGTTEITLVNIQKAISTFERTVVSRKSAFDRFIEGDYKALDDEQIKGLHLFRTTARCINCHNGPLFSDTRFHNLGQFQLGRPAEDLGMFNVTKDTADVGKFRTPSLRDVIFTAPWFHNGAFAELSEIIDMYERAMPQIVSKRFQDHPLNVKKSEMLKPLDLTPADKKALIRFMESISVRPSKVSPPVLPQ